MRMTIDDAIKHMKQARYDYCEYWEETRNDTTIAFDIAIDTMRKYQKITEIVKAWREVGLDYDSCDAMENIERVLDDGNDD